MATEVRVPATGNAGEDVILVEWQVAEGADVLAGQTLVTLETAKSTIEVDAPVAGRVLRIDHPAGAEVPEHAVLALIGDPEEAVGRAAPAPTPDATPDGTPTRAARPAASPRARVLAARHHLDLAALVGSGPGGRVIAGDVIAAHHDRPASGNGVAEPASGPGPGSGPGPAEAPDAAPVPAPHPDADGVLVPLSRARSLTARRMHESLQTTAQLTLTRYADADRLLGHAGRLREVTDARGEPRIGVNDLLLFAASRAMARHPEANSWFSWDGIRQFSTVRLGFAVDTGTALLVPVIADAQRLTLAALSTAARTAVERARSGRLTPQETGGGTFTVTNLGGLGVHWFTPVLNPPQSCILGIGAAHRAHPDGPAQLPLSLTFDHRALDGATAARVLADLADCIRTVDVLSAF
jgi:pyruvate dehydrogenase E2 component (dihydrolipoamide acetyltransferase)